MSLENNELYKDEMWHKINYYVGQGKISVEEMAELDFFDLWKIVEKIEEGGDE